MRYLLLLFLFFSVELALAQKNIFIAPSVEKNAEWVKIPYRKTVKKAAKGNREAVESLIAVYSAIEGKDLALHSRTVLEIMHKLGDSVFSKSVFLDIDRKYWPVLKKHLPSGQPLLEQPGVAKASLATVFPVTWAIFEGDFTPYQNMHCGDCAKDKNETLNRKPESDETVATKNKSRSEPKESSDMPEKEADAIDPRLLKPKSDKPLPPIPADVEKIIDDIIKKQQKQKAQGGG